MHPSLSFDSVPKNSCRPGVEGAGRPGVEAAGRDGPTASSGLPMINLFGDLFGENLFGDLGENLFCEHLGNEADLLDLAPRSAWHCLDALN
jgi:hypothetical protein